MSYFNLLCYSAMRLINESDLPKYPISISSIDEVRSRLIKNSESQIASMPKRKSSFDDAPRDISIKFPSVGLNTVGMLLDRLSILCIRFSKHQKGDPLTDEKILEIVNALKESRPGLSSISTKVTNLKSSNSATNFNEAFMGLIITNALLWEAQEVLYLRGVDALPDVELRDYIKFFSVENVNRNNFIQASEFLFWNEKTN